MMEKVVIKHHKSRTWLKIEIITPAETITCEDIDVTPDWIFIYGLIGGTGTGYSRGNLLRKIHIGEHELVTVDVI